MADHEPGRVAGTDDDRVVDLTAGAVSMLGAPVHAQVLAHLRDAVVLVDADGVVSYASPNTEQLLGRSADECIGERLLELFAQPDLGAMERALARSPDAPPDPGSLLFGGSDGAVTLYVDAPDGLGPPGTRLLTFRTASADPARGARAVDASPAPAIDVVDDESAAELAAAIGAGRLTVHYQPEIDLETGLVLGAEALVRWDHPDRGMVTAADFVELAETAGLISEIGALVMQQACSEFGTWARRFAGTVMILRVNLSAAQLGDRRLVESIRVALEGADLDPASLCVEVTETTLMSDPTALDVLDDLRALGVQVAVDDFGTGFSSLSQLKRLPVDVLKIDRSFVGGLGSSAEDTAITRAIVELARAVGLGVVAEGIEHPRQVDELLRLGCRRGQGWLYSRALPWVELEDEYLFD